MKKEIKRDKKKNPNFLRRLEKRFNLSPNMVYKALDWGRQRYRDTIINNRPVALENEFMKKLAKIEGIDHASLERFTMEFLFG